MTQSTAAQLSLPRFTLTREVNGKPTSVQITIDYRPENKSVDICVVDINDLSVRLFFKEPSDFDKSNYWRVHSTIWMNFAAYGDENNSNRAYPLECFATVSHNGSLVGYQRYEAEATFIHDIVSMVFEYLSKNKGSDDGMKRVSHLLYGVKGKPALYETCYQRALKKKGQFNWRFFK